MSSGKGEKQYSEPAYAQPDAKKNLPWYAASIDDRLVPPTRKLLDEYSGISRDQQSKHVHEIRDKAFAIRTYPCTGLGVFLIPYISLSPVYDQIITRLQDGESMLDVGTFLGGDFRRLAFDGAPTENMLGFDIANHWEVGFELFRDREKFHARFIEADLMTSSTDAAPAELKSLRGKTGIIHISAVLHQWDWDRQLEAAQKLVAFSKVGTLIVGHQIGNREAQEITNPHFNDNKYWRHDPGSMKRMWELAGEQTETKWETKAWLRGWEFLGLGEKDASFMEKGAMPLDFAIERVA